MDATTVAKALAAGRLLIGAALAVAPGMATRTWIGPHAEDEGAQLMARAAGARDVGLAAGTLASLSRRDQRRRWLEAAALADGVDLLATLAVRRALPASSVAIGSSLAGGSALAHLWLRRALA